MKDSLLKQLPQEIGELIASFHHKETKVPCYAYTKCKECRDDDITYRFLGYRSTPNQCVKKNRFISPVHEEFKAIEKQKEYLERAKMNQEDKPKHYHHFFTSENNQERFSRIFNSRD